MSFASTVRTFGISLAYRIDRNPVADSASRIVIFRGAYYTSVSSSLQHDLLTGLEGPASG